MSALIRTLLRAYGLAWQAATPLLARHKRLADSFADRLVPEGWPFHAGTELKDSVDGVSPLVWIQAASGGEAWLVHALVRAIASLPEVCKQPLSLLCTTGTRQGLDVLEKLAAEYAGASTPHTQAEAMPPFTILPRFFPLDKPDLMLRAVRAARPKAIVLLETELWPGLLDAAAREHCPVLVLNARMSKKSLSGYKWLSGFWDTHTPESIFAISPDDAKRFAVLFKKSRVSVMHNIKFDRVAQGLAQSSTPKAGMEAVANTKALTKASAGANAGTDAGAGIETNTDNHVRGLVPGKAPAVPLIALASVREEEEELLLPAIKELLAGPAPFAAVRVAVVPRHMHRVQAWQEALKKEDLEFILRSQGDRDKTTPQTGQALPTCMAQRAPILLWDTFGEMQKLYAMADAVFVGGSLAPLGGQNFLEPLAEGLIPCVGPYIKNFLWVGEDLFDSGLAVRVQWAGGLADALAARLRETLEVPPSAGAAPVSIVTWAHARHSARLAVQERFAAWVAPRTGGSLQAAHELVRFL